MSKTNKPPEVLFVTIFYLAVAVVLIVLCFVLTPLYNLLSTSTLPFATHDLGYNVIRFFGPTGEFCPLCYGTDGTAFIVVFIIFAAIVALDAVGVFLLKPWARLLAMLIALPLILIILGLVVLYVLIKPGIKQLFGGEATGASTPAIAAKKLTPEEEQDREEKDSEKLAAVKELVEGSSEVSLDDLASALEISRNALIRNVSEWSKTLGIKVKGNSVLIAPSGRASFLKRLASDMGSWPR
ncbi:MAG TPA: hypothetical protein VKK79_23665 [Candidatus Lokiarchaeia archaeon]|nr:hypothetical protein [Candidatus Lokiarchaeia archaeon]